MRILSIFHPHCKAIRTCLQVGCDLKLKRDVTSLVMANLVPINPHGSFVIDGAEIEQYVRPFPVRWDLK